MVMPTGSPRNERHVTESGRPPGRPERPEREDGRAARLGAAMQVELADAVTRLVKDPRVHGAGMLTITRVEVAEDVRSAKVWVSFVGGEPESAEAAMKGLARAAGFLRGEVTRRLSLRRAPELRFVHDRSAEAQARIEALLKSDP